MLEEQSSGALALIELEEQRLPDDEVLPDDVRIRISGGDAGLKGSQVLLRDPSVHVGSVRAEQRERLASRLSPNDHLGA